MEWKHLKVEHEGRVATVRFGRGDGRNALSRTLMREQIEVARSFEDDAQTSAIVLSAAGENFSFGFDLRDGAELAGHGLALSDVDVFAACTGPGSHTGLRVGLATIQGLAFGTNRLVVGVSALESVAADAMLHCPDASDGIDEPQPATAGRAPHIAARYVRQGALQLFVGLSVADGQVFGCCRERRRFVDFQAFILEVLVPEAVRRGVRMICLILDNGPTHAPKQVEAWLAQQQAVHQWPFEIKLFWLPKYASWLDQVEIWFSILPRKVLSPNHFESVAHLKRVLLDFIRYHNRTAKPLQWSYTIAKLEKKFGDETQDSMVPDMLKLVNQLAAQPFSIPAYVMEIPCLAHQISGRN